MKTSPQLAGHLGVVAMAALLSTCLSLAGETDRWTILPVAKPGSAITIDTSEEGLKRIYGSENVTRENIDQGEGTSEPGTVLFPNDPVRKLEILWQDRRTRVHPKTVKLRGVKSAWKTLHNISLGTRLTELERLNGRPFRLAGFGWDGSGGITSWEKGMLETDIGDPDNSVRQMQDGLVWLRLDPRQCGNVDDAAYNQLLGETQFSSANALMQKLNPCVAEIGWEFPTVK